jgi:hypothetical protein
MLMVRDTRSRERYEREADKLTEAIRDIIQNVNEAHEEGIFTEAQVSELFACVHTYERGTMALLRQVYEVGP